MFNRSLFRWTGTMAGILFLSSLGLSASAQTSPVSESPACFMVTSSGQVRNLNSVCNMSHSGTFPLTFSQMDLRVSLDAKNPQLTVSGIVTNASQKRVAVSKVVCQLLLNNRVVSTSEVPIITGSGGLRPGESRSFNQPLNMPNLDGVPLSRLRVQVASFS